MTYHSRQDETAEWLNYLQPEGLVVGPNVLRERGVTPIRQTPRDTDAAARALRLDTDAPQEHDRLLELHDAWTFFEQVLGWPAKLVAGSPGGPEVDRALNVTVPEHETLLAPDLVLIWNGEAPEGIPAQALVMLHPNLDAEGRNQFDPGEWEASPHQRLERLLRETNIGVGILVARNTLRLIYAPRGETAGWLSWPLAALGRPDGRPMLAGLKLCLGRNAFFTGAPETRLRNLLEASREAQNAVSEKLSGQVLGALYELLRGFHRAAPAQIEAVAERDPHHLYEGLLTLLMRLVFLLYAEDRDLLPSSTDPHLKQLWESGYSIKTLYSRLLVDEALNPDTMDERRGGWGQLLAVFRLIHRGHPDWVTGRGGKLFNPDGFPFLEGRELGSGFADATVLPVSDGTILRILHGLMTIEGRSLSGEKIRERLSYRSLDVESIGSVYETVMGFTTMRATERMIALRDEKKLPNFIGLDTLLALKPNDRQKWLKDHGIKLSIKQAKDVKEASGIASLVDAFGSLVDERASPKATPIGSGAPYLQPTEERRRTGSHYTPRSLTQPIVQHALEPAFTRLGDKASPEAVLSLKVLDPACGSGAFLVEACRQIGARLEQAWNMYGAEKPKIPPDEDEALHARRLVAQKCVYGVDRNSMAVDLARLSLWLATLARDHEFTFLDHALKAGDSLVGLTRAEIAAAHWDRSKPGLPLFRETIEKAVDRALEGREAIRNAADDVLIEAQAARYARVVDESEPARIVGNAVIAAHFSADKPRDRETERQKVESSIASHPPNWDLLRTKGRSFCAEAGWRPFHWEVEFPEVFARENSGFDAIVGNPPFLGGTRIATELSSDYVQFLRHFYENTGDRTDLVAYFYRRSFALLRTSGTLGLIASNTIAQGDTRTSGLEFITKNSGQIIRVVKRIKWAGTANVIVSVVHIKKGGQVAEKFIDGRKVAQITPFLVDEGPIENPHRLASNEGRAAEGMVPYSDGFRLAALRSGNSDVNLPYVRGKKISDNPSKIAESIIYFRDWSLEKCSRDYPSELSLVEEIVRPDREKRSKEIAQAPWWLFWRARIVVWEKLQHPGLALVKVRVSPQHAVIPLRQPFVPDTSLVVFPNSSMAMLAVLQSRVHEIWARFFSSSMKDDLRYAPSDCFETFPFPSGYETDLALEAAGQAYHNHRIALMIAADEGMTKTYNRFHDSDEGSEPVRRLREMHEEMDRTVLRTYGWDDLAEELCPEFLTEGTEDDHTYQDRYFWPSEGRDRVLARLLALNAERHAEEVAEGRAPTRAQARYTDNEDGEPQLDLN